MVAVQALIVPVTNQHQARTTTHNNARNHAHSPTDFSSVHRSDQKGDNIFSPTRLFVDTDNGGILISIIFI